MNILVLHGIEEKQRYAKAVVDLEFSFESFGIGNFLFHCYTDLFPEKFKKLNYDGIILWSTFLDARHLESSYNYVRREYAFIEHSNAIKIALPQDDYYCSQILDQWMFDWNVDYLYTILYEKRNKLYPKFSKYIDRFKVGYTGYVFPEFIKRLTNIKPWENRKIDVSYRANGTPTNLNSLAILKADIGERFKKQFSDFGYNLDISTKREDLIFGNDWYSFIEDSKFVLGVNSGSSINVPDLKTTNKINTYLYENPHATYEELVDKFLFDQEPEYFTVISPRNIEAAFLGSCQITTDLGSYSGLLEPDIHFIPIDAECTNVADVRDKMNDKSFVLQMIENSRECLMSHKRLRIEFVVDEILNIVAQEYKGKSMSQLSFNRSILEHKLLMHSKKAQRDWNEWRTHSKFLLNLKRNTGYYKVKELVKRGSSTK